MINFKNIFPFTQDAHSQASKDLQDIDKCLSFAEELPFLTLLNDNKTIITKNDSLVRVLEVSGIDQINSNFEEMQEFFNKKKYFVESLDSDFEYTFLHFHRKNRKAFSQEKSNNALSQEIIAKWQTNFDNIYVNRIYLVVTYKTHGFISKKLKSKTKLKEKDQDIILRSHRAIENHTTSLLQSLNQFHLYLLEGSDLLEVYDYIINPYDCEVRDNLFENKYKNDLSAIYVRSNIEFDNKGLIKFEGGNKLRYGAILSLKLLPQGTHFDIMEEILNEEVEFVLSQDILPQRDDKVKTSFQNKLNSLEKLPLQNQFVERISNIEQAIDLVESREDNFYKYDFSLFIIADDEAKLEYDIAKIEGVLTRRGIALIRESKGVRLKYFNLFPDLKRMSSRKIDLTLSNIADFLLLSSSAKGYHRCAFGDKHIVGLKTARGGEYNFTFHLDDSADAQGNTLVIGSTGSGKSMLTSFLLMNALNQFPELRILGFDAKEGLRLPVSLFDGKYIKYGEDYDLSLNPFQMEDSYSSRIFLEQFIALLAGGLEEEEQEIVSDAVKQVFKLDKDIRSLHGISDLFKEDISDNESNKRLSLYDRLRHWMPDDDLEGSGTRGMLFNAVEDALSFKKRWITFDMDLAQNSEVLVPLTSYIFHRFKSLVHNQALPHMVVIDEMGSYLKDKNFVPYIIDQIKQARKKTGMFLGLVQNIADVTENIGGSEILENMATIILFPNEKASVEYKEALDLSENEFNWLKNPSSERQVLIKKSGKGSTIVDIDLSILGKYMKCFSSDGKHLKEFKKLSKKKI